MIHTLWTIYHMDQIEQLNIDMSLTILGLECILLFRLTYSIKRYLTFAAIITNLLILTCQSGLQGHP